MLSMLQTDTGHAAMHGGIASIHQSLKGGRWKAARWEYEP